LFLEVNPEIICTAFFGSLNDFDSNFINSLLAAPSMGGAAILTRNAPRCSPTNSLRDARGTTRTAKVRPRLSSEHWITRRE